MDIQERLAKLKETSAQDKIKCLIFRLLPGKDFPYNPKIHKNLKIFAHVCFMGQRFVTAPVKYEKQPKFNDIFKFDFP